MAVDERSRHRLHAKLEQVLGPEEASTLMAHLPPVGWADVATKRDLDQLAVATKRDLDQLAVATKRDLDQLAIATKRDLDQLAVATKRDLDQLKAENSREHEQLRAEFKRDHETLEYKLQAGFRQELLHQTRTIMLAMSGSVIAVGSLAFAAARLI